MPSENVYFPDELYQAIRLQAEKSKVTFGQTVRKLCAEALKP